jgi:ABC-type methionine transport system ATPase subunit
VIASPKTGRELVDEYFIENRTRLLEIAGFLDRLDRTDPTLVAQDFRVRAFRDALALLSAPPADAERDMTRVERIQLLIKKVSADRTILMVEHNMSVVSGICDTITVLQRGATLAEGPYEQVSKNPAVIEAYMGSANTELKGAH